MAAKIPTNLHPCAPAELPGFAPSSGRVHVWLQVANPAGFRRVFPLITKDYRGPAPTSGSLMNDEALIALSSADEQLYFRCVSYQGDLVGWSRVLSDYCARHGLLTLSVSGAGVTLSNGRGVPWSDVRSWCD